MKKNIVYVLIGMIITVGIGVFANQMVASGIIYKDNITVEDAINDLYTKAQSNAISTLIPDFDFTITNKKNSIDVDISISDSSSVLTYLVYVDNIIAGHGQSLNYTVEALNADVDYSVKIVALDKYGNKKETISKIAKPLSGPIVEFTSGRFYVESSASTDVSKPQEYLFDGSGDKRGTYGSILFNSASSYIYFNVNKDVYITFTSSSYGDSGGGTGATANFYSIENDNEILFYALKQENNTSNYGGKLFPRGKYVLRKGTDAAYLSFEEWNLTVSED